MRRTIVVAIALTGYLVGLPLIAGAHGGGLDANGCHQNNQIGVYECHKGNYAGQVFASRADMEKGLPGRPAETKPESPRKANEDATESKSERKKTHARERADKPGRTTDVTQEDTRKVKEHAAETKSERAKTRAMERAEKQRIAADKKVEDAKAEKEKVDTQSKAEAKAGKKKAKAEEKAAKKKAKAEEKAAKERAKAEKAGG